MAPGPPRLRGYTDGIWRFLAPDRSRVRTAALVSGARLQHPALDRLSERRALRPG